MLETWTIFAIIIGILFLLSIGFALGLGFSEKRIKRARIEERVVFDDYIRKIIAKVSELENKYNVAYRGGGYDNKAPIKTNLQGINDRLGAIISKIPDIPINAEPEQNLNDSFPKNDDPPKETIGENQIQSKIPDKETSLITPEKREIKSHDIPSQINHLYNSGINNRSARSIFWEAFKITRIENANAVAQRLGEAAEPDFREAPNGEFLAVDGGNGSYFVVPLFDLTITSSAFNEGGIGYVFDCINYDQQSARSIFKIHRPATFHCEGGKWLLAEGGKGELEVQN